MKKQGSPEALAGVAVALIWGLTFLSIKVAVAELKPMTLALLRFIIATLLLPPIALLTKTSLAIRWRDLPLVALSGFLGVTLYFFFENNGIMRLSASESSIIIGTIPVLTLIVDMAFYRRRVKGSVVAGIVLSFVGVAVMVIRSKSAAASSEGYFYMVGAAFSWVAYTFVTKPLGGKYPLLSITFWQIFFGMLGCIPFALVEGQSFSRLSAPVILNVLFLGILASAIGYWLWVIVLDKLGASRSSVFINLIPVVSVIASFIVLGERLAPLQLAGGAATIAGVYLATKR
jgi:drug/metabolite transporter (DMT)-like permease